MTDQLTADLNAAAVRRDTGMLRGIMSSGKEWQDRAFAGLVIYAQYGSFIMEEARRVLHSNGLNYPADLRAWGAVTNRAKRLGLIEKTGEFRLAVSSNLSPKPVWTLVRS